uniref:Uncharacterized protein n=1 Tax=Setaria viridis TaxID=4556 RepID=A0A4V6D4K4_SETVI|nr:LOW QUALITY PROTEIN: hypothetical protein SEVIR_7G268800v2 [Setaria viridis]
MVMAEIATTLALPQVAHLAEAALGCFKDEMLHLLTKKRRTDFPSPAVPPDMSIAGAAGRRHLERIKLGLSRAIMSEPGAATENNSSRPGRPPADMPEGLAGMYAACNPATHGQDEFRYDSGAVPEYVLGGGGEADQELVQQELGHRCGGRAGDGIAGRPEKGNDSVGSSGGDEEADNVKDGGKGDGSDMSGLFGSDCRGLRAVLVGSSAAHRPTASASTAANLPAFRFSRERKIHPIHRFAQAPLSTPLLAKGLNGEEDERDTEQASTVQQSSVWDRLTCSPFAEEHPPSTAHCPPRRRRSRQPNQCKRARTTILPLSVCHRVNFPRFQGLDFV